MDLGSLWGGCLFCFSLLQKRNSSFDARPKLIVIKKIIFVALCSTISFWSLAQEDFHFLLGSEELSNVDVYGIVEDSNKTIWITTDHSLYSYDGYEFRHYTHPNQKSSSFFNPTLGYDGKVYFHDLTGQIYRVEENQLKLIHSVPDSLVAPFMDFDLLPDNELIVSSRHCYRVKDGAIEKIVDIKSPGFIGSGISRLTDGTLIVNYTADSIAIIRKDEFEITASPVSSSKSQLFYLSNNQLVINDAGNRLIAIDSVNNSFDQRVFFQSQNSLRIYPTSTAFWIASNEGGVQRAYFGKDRQSDVFFEDYYISHVYEDSEENILLGTFNNGIIVVPRSAMDVIALPERMRISKIARGRNNSVFIGSFKGQILEWKQGEFHLISESSPKRVEVLEYFPKTNQLISDRNSFTAIDLNSEQRINSFFGSLKDVTDSEEGEFIATSHASTSHIAIDEEIRVLEIYPTGRASRIVYSKDTKEVVVATSKGLINIDSISQMSNCQFEKDFLVNDLALHKGQVLVATQKYGLLKKKGTSLSSYLNTTDGLISNSVLQLEVVNDTLYVSTDEGFQIIGPDGRSIALIGESDGLKGKKIIDFAVDERYIWFLNQTGLLRMEKSVHQGMKESVDVRIQLVKVFLNGSEISGEINVPYDESELLFQVHAPTLSKSGDISYHYRLDNSDWNLNNYQANEIAYRSLSFGNHSFQIQLKYKNQVVDEYSIDFYVEAPYYLKWWFLISVTSLFVALTYFYFRKRLKDRIQRSNQLAELNASKLTALQSQMNPHFMFNALNSIQEYIMLNERKLAGKYLGKFADLMRIYLEFSQAKFVSLSDEINALTLFLELEKLRFEDSLSYNISVDQDVELACSIPAMLIQPYVENALKHGLLHKEADKQLELSFEVDSSGKAVICTIEDNGIGRDRSMEINQHRDPNHKSFATSATKQRLRLINQELDTKIGERTVDLFDADKNPVGTRVILTIPTT